MSKLRFCSSSLTVYLIFNVIDSLLLMIFMYLKQRNNLVSKVICGNDHTYTSFQIGVCPISL